MSAHYSAVNHAKDVLDHIAEATNAIEDLTAAVLDLMTENATLHSQVQAYRRRVDELLSD